MLKAIQFDAFACLEAVAHLHGRSVTAALSLGIPFAKWAAIRASLTRLVIWLTNQPY